MKNKSLNYIVWALIILIIIIGAWIIFENTSQKQAGKPYTIYNGYVIYEDKDQNSLRYRVEAIANDGKKYIHYFKTYPTDLLNLTYESNLKEKILYSDLQNSIKKNKIYFSYDPSMDGSEILTAGTLVQILGINNAGIYNIPTVISVTKDSGNPDFLIKTCKDATEEIGVIELRYGEPKIYSEGDCVIVQGKNREDFINMNDLLSYMLLGVIK